MAMATFNSRFNSCPICGAEDIQYDYHVCACDRVVCLACVDECQVCGEVFCKKCLVDYLDDEGNIICMACKEKSG